jgi:GNAT superfamily N-acetyltransferase
MGKKETHYLGKDTRGIDWIVEVQKNKVESIQWIDFTAGPVASRNAEHFITERARVQVTLDSATKAKFDIVVDRDKEDHNVGSLLLGFMEQYLGNKGINEFYGDIGRVDQGHFDKLRHFYKKNNYVLDFSENTSQKCEQPSTIVGRVYKKLN